MDEVKTKTCIYCKRKLAATIENFSENKKGKYGLGDVCVYCQSERQGCGVSSRQTKASKKAGKYLSGRIRP